MLETSNIDNTGMLRNDAVGHAHGVQRSAAPVIGGSVRHLSGDRRNIAADKAVADLERELMKIIAELAQIAWEEI